MALTPARAGGILLHPTSLPGPHGIGDLGRAAHEWLEFLAGAGCRVWQVLPLGHIGGGNSPYQSPSTFAGNPLLISLEVLGGQGLLSEDDLRIAAALPRDEVHFEQVTRVKESLLATAAGNWRRGATAEHEAFDAFREREASWLEDATLFLALKRAHSGRAWTEWPAPLAERDPSALAEARRQLSAEVEVELLKQFWFDRQWTAVRDRCRMAGVSILGDVPIYVSHDSADVWSHPELFLLDDRGRPTVVAGVPPDYFTSTGQLWGNPIYDWERHASTAFAWWASRVRAALRWADVVRIDHFRGLDAFWEVPAGQATAEVGRWVDAPGVSLLRALESGLGGLPLVAEDLGFMTEGVKALRERFRLPGMKILQFGFETGPEADFLPHNYAPPCVAYTGTHDNDTARGWYEHAEPSAQDFCRRYLASDGPDIVRAMIRALWSSVADWAIIPLQDLLGLGSDARMNVPGVPEGNWTWRAPSNYADVAPSGWLRDLSYVYGRLETEAAG
ncbi:MAG TPA: 4-alpha-glucanotransferase [Anaerolineales bacterium]|nr:4-alpha-glucanotransferase [Anaerolineales bacterium]